MKMEYKNKLILVLILVLTIGYHSVAQEANSLPKYHKGIVNKSQSKNRSTLLLAVKKQNINLIDSLLAKGLDINEPDVFGNTILGEFIESTTSLSFIDLLLQRGACLNCGKFLSQYILNEGIISDYNMPLCDAMINKDTNVFIFLLKKYKTLGFENVLYRRELIETSMYTVNYKALLEISPYFDFRAVNDNNIIGQTLFTAIAESLAISYILLLDEGKNIEIKSLLNEGIKIMEFLIAKGADINKPNDKGETALSLLKDIPLLNDFLISKKAK